ncbi:beta-lactamase family protein [Streptomyces sp. NBC_00726]|uniref:serine hydrolase domain-containing protein n=1 Tax=Streptomyces sp. NBC_00726 TaxID=2903674 RepID=UPI003864EADD
MRIRTTLVGATALLLTAALAAPAVAAGRTGNVAGNGHSATRKAIEAQVKAGVPGVTATVRDARGTWSTTAGVGDLRTHRPRSTADRYRIGSITKTFVSTVMLQLEAEGRLSLDDTVDRWLPGVVDGHGNDGSRITLRQLLNHTSGIYDYIADPGFDADYFQKDGFFEHRYDHVAPEHLVAVAMRHAPLFEPGARWEYSNTNYVLAALVIKKATGHSYGTEVTRRIIRPLHLRATSVPGDRVTLPSPSSRSYSKLGPSAEGPAYDVTVRNPSFAYSAGEMISDSADLDRFFGALLSGRLLPAKQLKEMKTTVRIDGVPNVRYGLALMDTTLSCGVHVWGHTGGIPGSVSTAMTTEDGRHSLALNFNGEWTGDLNAVSEAEYCGG